MTKWTSILTPPVRKWLRRVSRIAFGVVVAGLLIRVFVLVPLVNYAVGRTLRTMGYAQARFNVREATFFGADVSGLEMGTDPPLSVQHIAVDYSPMSLLHGRVQAIALTGVEIHLTLAGGSVELGGTTPAGDKGDMTLNLPFDRVDLRASSAVVQWEDRRISVPISGSITIDAAGAARLDIQARVLGTPIGVEGWIAKDLRNLAFTASAKGLKPTALLAGIPSQLAARLPEIRDGSIDLIATYSQSGDQRQFALRSQASGINAIDHIGAAPIAVEGLAWTGSATLGDAFQLTDLTMNLDVPKVQVGDQVVSGLSLAAGRTGDAIHVVVGARGEDWQLTKLDASLTGILGNDRGADLVANSTFAVTATPPAAIAAALRERGIGLEKASASISGNAVARLPAGSLNAWRIEVPEMTVALAAQRVDVLAAKASANSITGELHFRASANASGVDVFATPGSQLSVASASAQVGAEAMPVGKWAIDLGGQADRPLARFTPSGEVPVRIALSAKSANAILSKTSTFQAELNSASVDATIDLGASGGAFVQAVVKVNAAAALPVADISAGTISATIPIVIVAPVAGTTPPPSAQRGEFTIDKLTVCKDHPAAVSGRAALTNGRFDFDAKWSVVKDAALYATGWIDLTHEEPRGELTASLPRLVLGEVDKGMIARLAPALEGYDVTGTFHGDASLRLIGGQLVPKIHLALEDAKLANAEAQRTVDGISGSVTIDSLNPLATVPGQRLTIRQATLSKLKFTDGVCTFRIENPDRIVFEAIEFSFAGGRLYSSSFALDRPSARLSTVVTADKLNLGQVLPLFLDNVSGEGTLYGFLPVEIRWPMDKPGDASTIQWSQPQPIFGEGFVYATPGGGWLKIGNPDGLLGERLAEQDPRFAKGGALEPVRQALMQSLRYMDYSVLKMDFVNQGQEKELMAKLYLQGKAHEGTRAQEDDFTVNIRGFGELLKRSIGYPSKVSFGDFK